MLCAGHPYQKKKKKKEVECPLGSKHTSHFCHIFIIQQAETNGFCVEDVTVASQVIQEQQSNEEIVPWLQQYWDDFKSTATAQATNALSNLPGNNQRIQLSEEEVVEALYKHDGKMEKVVHECIEQRKEKVGVTSALSGMPGNNERA